MRKDDELCASTQSKDQNEITNSVKDTLKNCIITRGVKVDDLPTFDIDIIFFNDDNNII